MLQDHGHTVYPATDGYKALALLRDEKPVDIVLSDINMPGMDGVTLCRVIEAEFPNLPVLLISGRPRPDGIKAFVAKPFRADVLTREIEQLTLADRSVRVGEPRHAHWLPNPSAVHSRHPTTPHTVISPQISRTGS